MNDSKTTKATAANSIKEKSAKNNTNKSVSEHDAAINKLSFCFFLKAAYRGAIVSVGFWLLSFLEVSFVFSDIFSNTLAMMVDRFAMLPILAKIWMISKILFIFLFPLMFVVIYKQTRKNNANKCYDAIKKIFNN